LKEIEEWPWTDLYSFFPSPGIDLKKKKKLKNLIKKNTKICSDITLFEMARGKDFHRGTMIAITGTNGKTSTASIIYEILKKEGFDVRLAGNIGKPILKLKKGNKKTIYIIEVSSFQLEIDTKLKPEIAVLLNISEDHLDRHSNMIEYRDIKSNIFKNQDKNDYSIISIDDKYSKYIADKNLKSKKILFTKSDLSVDLNLPYNFEAIEKVLEIFKIEKGVIRKRIKDFKGLKHRMELVYDDGSIRFINDSKATNVSAANLAIHSFKDIFWIGGGYSKNNDLSKLNLSSSEIKGIFLIGSAASEIKKLSPSIKKPSIYKNLSDATKAAFKAAKKNKKGSILLSPGCSSHDQFRNYEDRGTFFIKIISSLTSKAE
jgi:UDP-N-acetylmuramoylalanine--D-glutamate ligase